MRRTAATAPARPVGPCITLASSSTSPCSFGSPPSPTESSFGSFSTTVTTATTASSVSPPAFKMSLPLSSACSPFALEMINGRFPAGAGERGSTPKAFRLAAPSAPTAPNRFAAPATAPPASDVRKNFRRDHTLIASPPLSRSIFFDSARTIPATRPLAPVAPHACLFLWRILNGKLRDFGENNFWLGGLDSNQDSQIQSLESYQLDDLPAGGTKTNRGTFPLIGTATILLI